MIQLIDGMHTKKLLEHELLQAGGQTNQRCK
jgi:hypothetical protein